MRKIRDYVRRERQRVEELAGEAGQDPHGRPRRG
jgi:hypothetical protein